MAADTLPAVLALNQRYLLDFPHEAARRLETMPAEEVADLIAARSSAEAFRLPEADFRSPHLNW